MEAGTHAAGVAPGAGVLGVRRRRWGEDAIRVALFAAAAISVLTTVLIVVALLNETIAFFHEVGIGDFFTGTEWSPLFADPQFGVLAAARRAPS